MVKRGEGDQIEWGDGREGAKVEEDELLYEWLKCMLKDAFKAMRWRWGIERLSIES